MKGAVGVYQGLQGMLMLFYLKWKQIFLATARTLPEPLGRDIWGARKAGVPELDTLAVSPVLQSAGTPPRHWWRVRSHLTDSFLVILTFGVSSEVQAQPWL